jgi:hypothetical protein
VKNEKYQNVAAGDTGVGNSEVFGDSDNVAYNVPGAAGYQWSVGGAAIGGIDGLGMKWFSPSGAANNVTLSAPTAAFSAYQMTWPANPGAVGQCLTSSGGGATPMTWSDCSGFAPGSPPPLGNVTPNTMNATALTYQSIPGVSFLVSHYAGIQDAINAAYNNGSVRGAVIDDRISPYTGTGFIVYDSVTLRLAPTTYTINGTVTYNNGNNNVTAGMIVLPGAHLLGAGTSTNHGTILQPANGLNADLLATSTVGTGTTNTQWWHWGEIAALRIVGNGANQTAGDCLKVENMGEVASIHDVELSACYNHNFETVGYAATQSAIANITSNRAVHGAGVAFTNLSGVAVLNGISGDCNQSALIAANFNAAGTLTVHGLKAEAESSICNPQVQDPVILASTTDATVLGAIKVDGGYAFGSTQHDFIKNTGPGTVQFEQENFYLTGYVNVLNDTVRGTTIANVATTTKQPVFYLSNGIVFGNQAFTFQGDTFMQGNPSGTPTEVMGVTSSSATLLADAGNGDNNSILAGGIQIAGHNRAIFGQSPETMARWGYRFLGHGGRVRYHKVGHGPSVGRRRHYREEPGQSPDGMPEKRVGELPLVQRLRAECGYDQLQIEWEPAGNGGHFGQLQRSVEQAGESGTRIPRCGRQPAREHRATDGEFFRPDDLQRCPSGGNVCCRAGTEVLGSVDALQHEHGSHVQVDAGRDDGGLRIADERVAELHE